MAMREYSYTLGQDKTTITETGTVTAVTGGASSLGGTIGVRLLVDTATTAAKADLFRGIHVIRQRILEDTWPLS